MILPIDEITNYLDTKEMHEIIQARLNEDGKVRHIIEDTNIEVIAVHDEDLDIKWAVLKDKEVVHGNVAIENLETTIKYMVNH